MKRNFAYTAISVGSRLLVGLLLFLLLARLWGPAQFGLFSLVFSVAALLTLLVDFGFALYLLREVAARPQEAAALIAQALRAKLLLSGLVLLLALLLGMVISQASLPASIALPLLLAALAVSFSDFFIAPLRALGRFDLEAGVVTLANVVQFALAGTVAWHGGTPAAVAWSMLLSRLLYLALAWRALHHMLPELDIRARVVIGPLATLRKVLPYGVDGMLITAWNQLDVVAVRLLFGVQAVGLYSAGQKIVLGVGALAPVVGNVMIPRLSGQAAQATPAFWRTAAKTSALLACIGLCFALPLVALPGQVASQLFGPSYAGLAELLPWFGGVLLVRYVGASAGVVITAAGLQARRVVAQVVGLAVAALLIGGVNLLGLSLQHFIASVMLGLLAMTAGYGWCLWRYRRGYAQ